MRVALHVLKELFGSVTVPPAVFDEVTKKRDSACGRIRDCAWIRVEPIAGRLDQSMYRSRLHAGEMEVIALARQAENPLLVMDDRAAKEMAELLELPVVGTLGILLNAKEKGVLPAVKPALDRIVANGFYIDDALYELVLNRAGEAPTVDSDGYERRT